MNMCASGLSAIVAISSLGLSAGLLEDALEGVVETEIASKYNGTAPPLYDINTYAVSQALILSGSMLEVLCSTIFGVVNAVTFYRCIFISVDEQDFHSANPSETSIESAHKTNALKAYQNHTQQLSEGRKETSCLGVPSPSSKLPIPVYHSSDLGMDIHVTPASTAQLTTLKPPENTEQSAYLKVPSKKCKNKDKTRKRSLENEQAEVPVPANQEPGFPTEETSLPLPPPTQI